MNIVYTPEDIAMALGRPAPTEEQSRIISSPLNAKLVVAGAGSGKTATMVDRVVWLVANGLVRADEVLGVTFTRKAAAELRERMRMRLEELRRLKMIAEPTEGAPVLDPVVSTYHSYANTLVANYGLRLGVEQDAQMLGGAQSWQLVAQLVEYVDPKLLPVDPQAKSTIIESVLALAGECAEHLVDPEDLIRWCEDQIQRLEQVPHVGRKKPKERDSLVARLQNRIFYAQLVQQYQRLKSTMQVMDYGDLISLAARIARDIPQARSTERERFKVVLLDEFQDTSHAQMQLFSDLFGGRNGHGEHPVMAVGDPKQSIYGFRGASDGQLFSFYKYFPTEHPEPGYLTVAWRNDSAVLHAANQVAAPLQNTPRWVDDPSDVQVPDLRTRPEPGEGTVHLGRYRTDTEEAEAVAAAVAQRRAAQVTDPEAKALTMAILCKKRAQMPAIATALEHHGVPYQIVGLGGLLDTPEVVDMVAILRVLADPGRSDALMRILSGARWRLGVADLLAFSDWASHLQRRRDEAIRTGRAEDLYTELNDDEKQRELERLEKQTASDITDGASLIEALEQLPEPGWTSYHGRSISETGLERLRALAAELDYLRQFMAEDLGTLLYAIEQTILLDIELAARPGATPGTARQHIDAFHDVAAQYAQSAPRINATLLAGSELLHDGGEDAPEPEEADTATQEQTERTLRFSLSSGTGSPSGVNGFLAWLDAAAAEESGLDMATEEPRTDVVQILTVHASKGLEWDHVYIPGMNHGDFPRLDDPRWTQNSKTLPWPLRGDRGFLPKWRDDFLDTQEIDEYLKELKDDALMYRVNEERRLAYVGITRARSVLVLTGSAWQGTKAKPALASEFWLELAEDAERSGEHHLEVLTQVSEEQIGAENPQSATLTTALWPFDPLEGPETMTWSSLEELHVAEDRGEFTEASLERRRRERLQDEERFRTSRRARMEAAATAVVTGEFPAEVLGVDQQTIAEVFPETDQMIQDWEQEAALLLEILHEPRAHSRFELPAHLSASNLVSLADDSEAVVANMIRPMPQRPGIAARAGTIFHAWVESHVQSSAMLDVEWEDFADSELEISMDLPAWKENFLASRWAERQPWAVEYPIETPLEGISVRGRVDAIYRDVDDDGVERFELVDWKTGRSPATAKDRRSKSMQLALYRLAFARLHNLDVSHVSGTFFYVAENREWSPEKFADEQELTRLLRRAKKLGTQYRNGPIR